MPIKRSLALVLTLCSFMLQTSCTQDGSEVIGGVDGKFCVPAAYRVPAYWWIDGDSKEAERGFAFVGCRRASLHPGERCDIPSPVVSSSAEPRTLNDHIRWRTLKESADLGKLSESELVHTQWEGTSIVVASASIAGTDGWYLFSRSDSTPAATSRLVDEDQLVLGCETDRSHNKQKYRCRRYFRGSSYAIRYEFLTDDRIPLSEMGRLDHSLIRLIDSWQCR